MRQIDHFDSKRLQLLFGLHPSAASSPVIPYKYSIKTEALSQRHLVQSVHDLASVNIFQIPYDLGPVFLADHRLFSLVLLDKLIRIHANDQRFTIRSRLIDNVQMSDMEHIKYTLGVSDPEFFLNGNASAIYDYEAVLLLLFFCLDIPIDPIPIEGFKSKLEDRAI